MTEAVASASHGHVPAAGLRLLGDDRLARRAAKGDPEAFAVLYRRHHQALYRYCRAILGNSEDAADALQNTMTAALRALPGERREIRVKPWLYRIAHNESVSLLRRRAPTAPLDAAMNVAAPAGSDAETRERLRQLVTDLHELQDRQRGALVMRELSGLGYEEIAAALGSTPAAAKQLVYEARTGLHEMAEGRDMSCDSIRRSLSAEDRRMLRGRKVRAHLAACPSCREFQAMIGSRRRDLAAMAPPLPVLAAASLLKAIAGGGQGGGAIAGLVGGGAGKVAATSALVKGVATVAVVATVGAGTAQMTGQLPSLRGQAPSREATQTPTSGISGSSAPAAGAPGASGSQRPGNTGPARRHGSKALAGTRGRRTHAPMRGGRAKPHQQAAGKSHRGSRPQSRGSRPAVRPLPKVTRKPVPGDGRAAPAGPGAVVPGAAKGPVVPGAAKTPAAPPAKPPRTLPSP